MKINFERLKNNVLELAEIGKDPVKGVTRKGFSNEEKEAQNWLKEKLDALGLSNEFDPVGNLIAYYPGSSEKDIIIGSHLDTVPQGGIYDGALGVLSGLEVIATLKENAIKLPYGIRLVSFVAEEGSKAGGTFGSRCVAGQMSDIDDNILQMVNLTNQSIEESVFDRSKIKCYLELHIEQGGILESEEINVGVVTGIVGIQRFVVNVSGKSNHAGTTPMDLRDDALLKATYLIQAFYDQIDKRSKEIVGTIGTLEVSPGAVNVIPGEVEFVIEMRGMDFSLTDEVIENLKTDYLEPEFKFKEITRKDGVYLNKSIIEIIKHSCEDLDYSYKLMQSGAGHDANSMAKIIPTGMIFVPSIGGISHSYEEYSKWEDIEKAANVLLTTVLKI
ncbi:MAG: Zn-dependent hydrolase [Clostridia bacterium]